MLPQHDKADKPADISAVIDLALRYNPNLATADLSTVRMWVNEGCDIDKDIIPALVSVMARKKDIGVFKYFTNPVLASRDKRLINNKPIDRGNEKPDEYYINIYKWKRDRGMSLTTEQEKTLKAYEEANL